MNNVARSIAAALVAAALIPLCAAQESQTDRERQLLQRIERLEQRIAALEAKEGVSAPPPAPLPPAPPTPGPVAASGPPPPDSPSLPGFLAGTTINGYLDGYYGYNFIRPLGRVNLLRSNDVSSNSFTLNQADLVIERAPDASKGRRLGFRLDLMFGQETESMQGNPLSEPRPQAYRNIYQAYGSYVLPVGSGLQVDFGKFGSSFGYETNWTKDQFNYSRSYFFTALPYYHLGFRTNYKLNDKVNFQYWLVNGVNQAEDFNGLKSNAFLFAFTPSKNVSWNVNYYVGEDNRDLQPNLAPAIPALPTQPGLSFTPVAPRPNGKQHIFDAYATWNAAPKLTLAGEADFIVSRTYAYSYPARLAGGAGYARYQFTDKFNLAGRFEYADDRGGYFSGVTQALKSATATGTYQPADGFQVRTEYRRDFSNLPFFLTDDVNRRARSQNTATLGLIWWFGGKQGAW